MFFKSSIPKDLILFRKENNIDHLDSSFKLFLLESSMYVRGAKARNTLDGMINYFLDTKGQIPKDPKVSNSRQGVIIHKLGDGVVSPGYILMQLNDLKNKLSKRNLSHQDFDGIPNYEGLRDRVKDLFKLEILKKREEDKKIQREADEKKIRGVESNIPTQSVDRREYYLRLSNDMHYLKGIKNIDAFMNYLMDNKNVLIPGGSSEQSFNSRKLVYLVHTLRNKIDRQDSDFNILPNYDGFREKVKQLLS